MRTIRDSSQRFRREVFLGGELLAANLIAVFH